MQNQFSTLNAARGGLSAADLAVALCLAAAITALHGAIAAAAGLFGWDDGAITLSYARTIAEGGGFALTPGGPEAEGTSSLLWMLVNAAGVMLGGAEWTSVVARSQWGAALCGGLAAGAFFLLAADRAPERGGRLLLSALVGLLPQFAMEAVNGMEMALFALLLLVYAEGFEKGRGWSLLLLIPLALVRLEASFYLIFALTAAAVLARSDARRRAVIHLGAILAVFGAVTLWRMAEFGLPFPNTVFAKMHAPYSEGGVSGLIRKAMGGAEFLYVSAGMLGALALWAWRGAWRPGRADLRLWLAIGICGFAFVTGKNWGYAGRMHLAAAPLLAMLVLEAGRAAARPGAPVWRPAAMALGLALAINAPVWLRAVTTAAEGRALAATWRIDGPQDPAYGITPGGYALTGRALEDLAAAAGVARLRAAIPDVGGSTLASPSLLITDMALLTDPVLAAEGYAALPTRIEAVSPHVIQIHGIWARSAQVYESGILGDAYRPAAFRNMLFWLRADLHAALTEAHGAGEVSPDAEQGLIYMNQRDDLEGLAAVWGRPVPVIALP